MLPQGEGAPGGVGGEAEDKDLEAVERERRWAEELERAQEIVDLGDMSDQEKVRALSEILTRRIEEARVLEESTSISARRLEEATKSRDRFRSEHARAGTAKAKLEGSCRDFQQQKQNIAKENARIQAEEQSRHAELKEKFEQAIKDVQEKMDAELEVQQHFLKENKDLRGKLEKFTETYEAQEEQLAEQRESRERELEMAQQRLQEHETLCRESKVKSAKFEKENTALRKSETTLRAELQTIMGRFDDFHDAITGSNQRHGDCKEKIDTLQGELGELEKDNAELKKPEELNRVLEEKSVNQKQVDALDKLCNNLAREKDKLEAQLTKLRGED